MFTTPGPAQAGDINVDCTLVRKVAIHCDATARLHDGTLELSGLVTITSPDVRPGRKKHGIRHAAARDAAGLVAQLSDRALAGVA